MLFTSNFVKICLLETSKGPQRLGALRSCHNPNLCRLRHCLSLMSSILSFIIIGHNTTYQFLSKSCTHTLYEMLYFYQEVGEYSEVGTAMEKEWKQISAKFNNTIYWSTKLTRKPTQWKLCVNYFWDALELQRIDSNTWYNSKQYTLLREHLWSKILM